MSRLWAIEGPRAAVPLTRPADPGHLLAGGTPARRGPRKSARPKKSQFTPRSTGRCPDMTTDHSSYDDLARERRDSTEYREGYAEAQRAFLIGQAVRERRLALRLSQTELAARAGMTQPALSRLEAGGGIPPHPLLARDSPGLGARP